MSAWLSHFEELLVRLFMLALRLYPDEVRSEYAAEMQAVFRLKAADAARQGAWKLFALACCEVRDLPSAVVSAHFHANGGRMLALFPSTSDRTPWAAALLSLLPFLLAGPVRIVLSYQPGWAPQGRSLFYALYLLLCLLAVAGGLVIGAVRQFPRWVYPYIIQMALLLYLLVGYAAYLLHVNMYLQNSFFVYLAVILIILALPGLRAFYRNISQDWTLLSYGLYGLVLYLLATLDFDETPHLSLLVLLPSLLSLGAALFHLRIRSAARRMAVLLAGTFAGVFFWLIPIFQGMVSLWIGIFIGLSMLLIYGVLLVAILLAPLLVKGALHSWRSSRV